VEPAPPPITIVNPNDPTGTSDVLDNGRESWRTSPRQKVAIALTAIIVALVSGGVAEIRHVHHEDDLDAAVLRDVTFAADPSFDDGGVGGEISLVNEGKLPVHILGITLVGEGYREHRMDVTLASLASAPLELSSAKNCRVAMLSTDPQELRVRARSARGGIVVRRVGLTTDLAVRIGFTERERCGYFRPQEALSSEVASATRRGRDVVVTMTLYNEGVFPLTLSGLQTPPGLTVSAHLPITLPRRTYWTGRSPGTLLTLTLHVDDCAAFAGTMAYDSGNVIEFDVVRVELTNGYVADQSFLPLSGFEGDPSSDSPPRPVNAMPLLVKSCPSSLFPHVASDVPSLGGPYSSGLSITPAH
jgi:hypothetical protein